MMKSRREGGRAREELADLRDLPRSELVKRWLAMHGQPAPKGISRRLLEYAVAYDLQSRAFGGLKPSAIRELRQMSGGGSEAENQPITHKRRKSLSPGTRLLREWHGHSHTVDVVEDGFLYDGRHYHSLSEIARTVTGAERNRTPD